MFNAVVDLRHPFVCSPIDKNRGQLLKFAAKDIEVWGVGRWRSFEQDRIRLTSVLVDNPRCLIREAFVRFATLAEEIWPVCVN